MAREKIMNNFKGKLIKCPKCGNENVQLWGDVELEIKSWGLAIKDCWGTDIKFDCNECDHEWDYDQERDGS